MKNDGSVKKNEHYSQYLNCTRTVDGLVTSTQLGGEFRMFHYTWVLSDLTDFW